MFHLQKVYLEVFAVHVPILNLVTLLIFFHSYKLMPLALISIILFYYSECINFNFVVVCVAGKWCMQWLALFALVITWLTTNGWFDWLTVSIYAFSSILLLIGKSSHLFIPNMSRWDENLVCARNALIPWLLLVKLQYVINYYFPQGN